MLMAVAGFSLELLSLSVLLEASLLPPFDPLALELVFLLGAIVGFEGASCSVRTMRKRGRGFGLVILSPILRSVGCLHVELAASIIFEQSRSCVIGLDAG